MKEVQLFVTCIIDTLYPTVGEAVVRVLEKAGVQIIFPIDQTCCGQPAFNAGLWKDARKMAMHTIEVFEKSESPIVIPSGSCTSMIRNNYQELFREDSLWLKRAKAIASRTYEFSEFLVDVLNITDVGARFEERISYHSSCHLLRELGVDRQPRLLLSNVKGIDFVELPHADECCGFGGVFSVEFPEISGSMLQHKIENIEKTEAPVIVTCDAGCMTHINGGLHRQGKNQRVYHIAEILDSQ